MRSSIRKQLEEVTFSSLSMRRSGLAHSGDILSAIARMQAACNCEGAKGSTHEMLAQLLLEGGRSKEAVLATQDALVLGDQVSLA